mmetsp:Transcript_23501/g.53624  ORF Transcript_23501/g.53624 Transcript_23501/m.53624 type:complete len:93 (+) Transcript_23501:1723-2001(+)
MKLQKSANEITEYFKPTPKHTIQNPSNKITAAPRPYTQLQHHPTKILSTQTILKKVNKINTLIKSQFKQNRNITSTITISITKLHSALKNTI